MMSQAAYLYLIASTGPGPGALSTPAPRRMPFRPSLRRPGLAVTPTVPVGVRLIFEGIFNGEHAGPERQQVLQGSSRQYLL